MDCIVHGITKSQTGLSDFHFHIYICVCMCVYIERDGYIWVYIYISVQFSHSVVSNSATPWSAAWPGLPVHHQLPEFTQTHAH